MKIVICPLVNRDIKKSIRCVKSCLNLMPTQYKFIVHPVINSKNNDFVQEFVNWCNQECIPFKITPSNGTPSKGKNECLKFFKNTIYDGMCMLDGDDMYYPSAGLQIEKHLNHHPGTDLLIVKPSDQINNSNGYRIDENTYAVCWRDNILKMNYTYGPDKHECFTNRHAAGNLGGHVFYSKKLVNLVKYDEEQLLGEDLLFEFECLKLHQQGKISFWLSFATDVQFLDRTGNENIQSQQNQNFGHQYYERLISKIRTIIDEKRSSFNELPVEFPEIIFNYDQKINWIRSL